LDTKCGILKTAPKHVPSAFAHFFTDGDFSIEYGLQAPFALDERWEHHNQLLASPDAAGEAELCWREPEQAGRGIRVEGAHVIYIPRSVPFALKWLRKAALARFSFTPGFIKQSAADTPRDKVFVCHEWEIAGADLMVHQLFIEIGKLCRNPKDATQHPRYMNALGALVARHFLPLLDRKPGSQKPPGLPLARLKRVQEHIDKNLQNKIKTGELAGIAGFGEHHFTRLFKASTGMAPCRYIIMKRLELARQLLAEDVMDKTGIALEAGFCDASHLRQAARRFFSGKSTPPKITPVLYRKSGKTTIPKKINRI